MQTRKPSSGSSNALFVVVVLPNEREDDATLFQRFSSALVDIYFILPFLVRIPLRLIENDEHAPLARALGIGGTTTFAILNITAFETLAAGNILDLESRTLLAVCHPDAFHAARKAVGDGTLDTRIYRIDLAEKLEDSSNAVGNFISARLRQKHAPSVFQTLPPIVTKGHNLTAPNYAILSLLDVPTKHADRLISTDEKDYVTEIARSVTVVEGVRKMLVSELDSNVQHATGIGLIVAIPGVARDVARKTTWDTRKFGKNASAIRKAMLGLARQKDYMHATDNPDEHPIMNPFANGLYLLRAQELRVFTVGLTLLSTSFICPVIRVPPRAGVVWSELRDAEAYEKRGDAKATGRQRAIRISEYTYRVGLKIRDGIPAELFDLIIKSKGHIKLVSDAPAELIPVEGVPLSMVRTVTRICATPGNVFMQQCFSRKKIFANSQFFSSVLIVRSFSNEDPLRFMVEQAINTLTPTVRVRIVDVHTSADFCDTINSASESIVIFDGHGNVNEKQVGYLKVGEDNLIPWEIRSTITRPPRIFFLSSCLTHSLDTSHASVANGLLAWGCNSVVGTLGKLDGGRAALTVGRFINWLQNSIVRRLSSPGWGPPVSWAEAFAHFLRQVYAFDVLDTLIKFSEVPIPEDEIFDYLFRANQIIYSADPWIDKLLQDIEDRTGCSTDILRSEWQKYAYFPDAVKYVHFGRPEDILLCQDKSAPFDE